MTEKTDSKKVLVLLGSPRKKGNSTTLAKKIIAGAEAAGATVEQIYLHGQDIAPCNPCYACQKPDSKGCAIDDDMPDKILMTVIFIPGKFILMR